MPRGSQDKRGGKGMEAYRRKAKRLKRKGLPCSWCGRPIDYTLPANHPMAFTYDHTIPLSRGGDLLGEGTAMHRSCNAKKGSSQEVRLRPDD